MTLPATIETLRARGSLRHLDVELARRLCALEHESREEVALAIALTSRRVAEGHLCLDLDTFEGSALHAIADEDAEALSWPANARWLATLRESRLFGDADAVTPLVLHGARVYLRRYWDHQGNVAKVIRERSLPRDDLDEPLLKDGLDRLFAATKQNPDWQRVAALMALRSRFCVVSGGPGTGKTFTVVKILALVVEQELAKDGGAAPRITLVAPTGKAAARLNESIKEQREHLVCSDAVKAAIDAEASTVHRALGVVRGRTTRFYRNAENPLESDVVLVDESSMVDAALMARLLAAVPPHARLILLGDKDQLASVEAGAVLGEICAAGLERGPSRDLIGACKRLSGDALPVEPAGSGGLGDCVVHLTRSYRYAPGSGIEALAEAINGNEPERALDVLGSDRFGDVRLEPHGERGRLTDRFNETLEQGYRSYLDAVARGAAPREQLAAFGRFRVLAAHRKGPLGVEGLNRHTRAFLARAGHLDPEGEMYPGRPMLIRQNDYALGLYNGDVGLLVDSDGPGAEALRAFFLDARDRERWLSPGRLPMHETVFAMTVHKSQGSEFDHVCLVLPHEPSPVLTRELLYTAVTRAKKQVTIFGSPTSLGAGIEARVDRSSGLRELLSS